jgi:hypothetical protein
VPVLSLDFPVAGRCCAAAVRLTGESLPRRAGGGGAHAAAIEAACGTIAETAGRAAAGGRLRAFGSVSASVTVGCEAAVAGSTGCGPIGERDGAAGTFGGSVATGMGGVVIG